MFQRSVQILRQSVEKGNEVEESKQNKLVKMDRVIEILGHVINAEYLEIAQSQLGIEYALPDLHNLPKGIHFLDAISNEDKENNWKISQLSEKLEEIEWAELWTIIKGTENKKIESYESPTEKDPVAKPRPDYSDFDGTDMRGWWT